MFSVGLKKSRVGNSNSSLSLGLRCPCSVINTLLLGPGERFLWKGGGEKLGRVGFSKMEEALVTDKKKQDMKV